MLSLQPQKAFPIVRKLSVPTDTATYYVQAVVRNSLTDVTISTVNLANDGLGIQRFVGSFQAPADASGEGLWIDVVTKVYSDSGYTTQDTDYADEVESYLVIDRTLGLRGGGGIDSRTIRRIIQEELGKIPKDDKKEEKESKDRTDEIIKSIRGDIRQIVFAISKIEIPETDLKPLLKAVKDKETLTEKDLVKLSGLIVSNADYIKKQIASLKIESQIDKNILNRFVEDIKNSKFRIESPVLRIETEKDIPRPSFDLSKLSL